MKSPTGLLILAFSGRYRRSKNEFIHEVPGRPDSYHNTGDELWPVVPGKMEGVAGVLVRMIEAYGSSFRLKYAGPETRKSYHL